MLLISLLLAGTATAADVILNEYNAVGDSQFLAGGQSDTYWGRVQGNGGDWYELVIITDHLDMRGWRFEINDSTGGDTQVLTLTSHPIWSDLRSGTILTISEDLGNNIDDYIPALGQWWLNVRAANSTNGTYITAQNFRVNNSDWQLTIRNHLNAHVYGPAGEGVNPVSGVGNDEVCKLEANPSASITPLSNYRDGTSSTFGSPNTWSGGANVQDFASLRSVVPYYPLTSVVINEVLAHTDLPMQDFIELHNTTSEAIDVSYWFLTDNLSNLTRFQIPPGTVIAANGYLVFYESQLGFSLNSSIGEDVALSEADANGVMLGGRDYIKFGPSENGVSLGRFPNGSGSIYALLERTPGAANALPRVGPIVINELMYHPPSVSPGVDNLDHEFVELHNVTNAPANLFTYFPGPNETHPWRLSSGIDYLFPIGTTIPARGFLLVVSFDPLTETAKLEDFRVHYELDDTVDIIGPYNGQLSNSGETIQLHKPDTPQPPPEVFVPYVLVAEVPYTNTAPWPTSPAGQGPSLERIDPFFVGDWPTNWTASGADKGTPGCPNDQESPIPGDIDGDGQSNDADVEQFVALLLGEPAPLCQRQRADLVPDGVLDALDIQPFVVALISQ